MSDKKEILGKGTVLYIYQTVYAVERVRERELEKRGRERD